MKTQLLFALSTALVLAAGCNNRDRVDQDASVDDSANDGTTTTERVVQQPGEISKVTQDKDHADVVVKKQITETKTKVETEKKNIPTVAITQHKADINRMSKDDFQAMGLSKDAADRVVEYRRNHGDFRSVDDLRNVPGMSNGWLSQIRSKLAVSTAHG